MSLSINYPLSSKEYPCMVCGNLFVASNQDTNLLCPDCRLQVQEDKENQLETSQTVSIPVSLMQHIAFTVKHGNHILVLSQDTIYAFKSRKEALAHNCTKLPHVMLSIRKFIGGLYQSSDKTALKKDTIAMEKAMQEAERIKMKNNLNNLK